MSSRDKKEIYFFNKSLSSCGCLTVIAKGLGIEISGGEPMVTSLAGGNWVSWVLARLSTLF